MTASQSHIARWQRVQEFLPHRLSKALKHREMSESTLSLLIGNDRSWINQFTNGGRIPNTKTLVAISKELKVSIDWLLGLQSGPIE